MNKKKTWRIDLHHFNADLDPSLHFNADPDPYNFNADSDADLAPH
jgi:hypothetical protein